MSAATAARHEAATFRTGPGSRRAAWTLIAVLGAFGCSLLLRAVTGLGPSASVLAVVLTVTLRRVPHDGLRNRVVAAVEVIVIGFAAGGVGWLLVHEPWVGDPLLVLGLSVGIYARRFGDRVRAAGRLVALPFVALLVTPHVAAPDGASGVLWAPLIAVLALAWSMLVPGAPAAPPPVPTRRHRLDAPTRMAVQMAVGVGAACVVGHLVFGAEWAWTAVSAFLVQSGNRGRGDVVHKAGLRVLGAAGGTVVAGLGAARLPAGHALLIVALFVILFAALVLRERSYAWWAAGVTAMISLVHAYYGPAQHWAVTDRLLGVLVGSALGLASAWFVLPVRTSSVLRRRIADALAALTDDLSPEGGDRYRSALARLDEIAPSLRAHRRVRRGDGVHAVDAIAALHRLAPLPRDDDERRRLRRDTVRVRRAMVGRDDPRADDLVPELAVVHTVLSSHNAHS